uniref:TetR family transcriptional regulator C-terminal domain-containing protein n=1 Tax=Roseihalotalea indica TaxID=2867963 RepID=A0AA49JH85_9BACT|nr:TetR family transcriptional regulator C-terminal domain-containing protein [Tunicatimonas sp. TK19036]
MAATTSKKNKQAPEDQAANLKEAYIDYLLEYGQAPPSVYQFTKRQKMKEAAFYDYFNSFTALEKEIWKGFLEETITRIQSDPVYMEYSVREKLLAFYYTFIEILKNNRSYVMVRLEHMPSPGRRLPNNNVFSNLKGAFIDYANELIAEGKEIGEIVDRPIIGNRYDEGLWRQLQFVIYFWVKDDSPGFEKTDAAIEKAVNLSFDIMGRGPIDAAVDFAKFLYQQR